MTNETDSPDSTGLDRLRERRGRAARRIARPLAVEFERDRSSGPSADRGAPDGCEVGTSRGRRSRTGPGGRAVRPPTGRGTPNGQSDPPDSTRDPVGGVTSRLDRRRGRTRARIPRPNRQLPGDGFANRPADPARRERRYRRSSGSDGIEREERDGRSLEFRTFVHPPPIGPTRRRRYGDRTVCTSTRSRWIETSLHPVVLSLDPRYVFRIRVRADTVVWVIRHPPREMGHWLETTTDRPFLTGGPLR